MRLWIDDERPVPQEYTHNAFSSRQAMSLITKHRDDFEIVSFDHDLGVLPNGAGYSDDTSRPVLLWMIENDAWPTEVRFHTANPVGREWLVGMAQRYSPPYVTVNLHDPYMDLPGMRTG